MERHFTTKEEPAEFGDQVHMRKREGGEGILPVGGQP
jgi:hypothetical protein